MLLNYSLLKGVVTADLEDSIKRTSTHHNFIVCSDSQDYQININIQSSFEPDVKVFPIYNFNNSILECLAEFPDEGLFTLSELPESYRVDYLRSNILQKDDLKKTKPSSWIEISELLDQYIKSEHKIYVLGEFYSDSQNRGTTPYGLKLREVHIHLPPRGIHNIHMNQGTPSITLQSKDNGTYQDGAIFVEKSNDYIDAFFFMFSGQCLTTDKSGNCTT